MKSFGQISWNGGNWKRVYHLYQLNYAADLALATGIYTLKFEWFGDLNSDDCIVKLGLNPIYQSNGYTNSSRTYLITKGDNDYMSIFYAFSIPHGLDQPCKSGSFKVTIIDALGKEITETLYLDGFDRFEFSVNNNRVIEPNTDKYFTSKGGIFRPEGFGDIDFKEFYGSEHVTAYKNCGLDLKVYDMCRTNAVMELEIAEFSIATRSVVTGTRTSRLLTAAELDLLHTYTSPYLNFKSFTGSNGIKHDFSKPKAYYQLILVDKRHGQWRPNFKFIQFKDDPADFKMSDNLRDLGFEPNQKVDYDIYHSPYLFNRNVPSSAVAPYALYENIHQNPDFVTIAGNENRLHYVYDNIGCNTTDISGELRMYWTRARTDELWDVHWKFNPDLLINGVRSAYTGLNVPAGSEITILNPTPLNPYNATSDPNTVWAEASPSLNTYSNTGEKRWFCPDPRHFDAINGSMSSSTGVARPVICFLAKINTPNSLHDPIVYEPTTGRLPVDPFVRNNNNVVTRNSLIYDDPDFLVDRGDRDWDYDFSTIWVNNPTNTPRTQDICIEVINNEYSQDFRDFGRIELGTTDGIWSTWVANGMNLNNVSVLEPTLFEVTDSTGCINNITIQPRSYEQIGLRFVYDGNVQLPSTPMHFTYRVRPVFSEAIGTNTIIDMTVPTQSPVGQSSYKREPIRRNQLVNEDFIVFPNPTEGKVLITSTVTGNVQTTLQIRDSKGLLIQQTIKNSIDSTIFSTILDLTGLRDGIYSITQITPSSVITKRVVLVN